MNLSQHRHITKGELADLIQGMEEAERSGMFDGLFCKDLPVVAPAASRETLIQSISPEMSLTKGFFRKIYGYELTSPGFREKAIGVLEAAGCSRAGAYYENVVDEYQKARDQKLKAVAAEYARECDRKWQQEEKEGEEQRKQRKIELLTRRKVLLNSLKSTEN